jgi:hypothetical protein
MHISDIEKARMEKEHKMRNGYQVQDNKRYPHMDEIKEHQHVWQDNENRHARETKREDYNMEHSA